MTLESESNMNKLVEERQLSNRRESQIKDKEIAISNLSTQNETGRRQSLQF